MDNNSSSGPLIVVTGTSCRGLVCDLSRKLRYVPLTSADVLERICRDEIHPDHTRIGETLLKGGAVTNNELSTIISNELTSHYIKYHGAVIEVSAHVDETVIKHLRRKPSNATLVQIRDESTISPNAPSWAFDPVTGDLYNREMISVAIDKEVVDSDQDNEEDMGHSSGEIASESNSEFTDMFKYTGVSLVCGETIAIDAFNRLLVPGFEHPVILPKIQSNSPTRLEVETLIPTAFHVKVPSWMPLANQAKQVRVFLECHSRWNPTVVPQKLEFAILDEALQGRSIGDHQYHLMHSQWGTLCPAAHLAGDLTPGLPQFSLSFRNCVYFASSDKYRQHILSHPEHYLLGTPSLKKIKIMIPGYTAPGLAEKIAQFYGVPYINLHTFLDKSIQSNQVPFLTLSMSDLKSGKSIGMDVGYILQAAVKDAKGWVVSHCPLMPGLLQSLDNMDLRPSTLLIINQTSTAKLSCDENNLCQPDQVDKSLWSTTLVNCVPEWDSSSNTKVIKIDRSDSLDADFSTFRQLTDPFTRKADKIISIGDLDRVINYCPVTLAENFALQKGETTFGVSFEGNRYLCASEIKQSQFIQNPYKYTTMTKLPPNRYFIVGPQGSEMASLVKAISVAHGLEIVDFTEHLRDLQDSNEFELITDANLGELDHKLLDSAMCPLFLSERYTSRGFILHGFPRTRNECAALQKQGWAVTSIIVLTAQQETLITRVLESSLKDNPHIDSLRREHAENNEDSPIDILRQDITAMIEQELLVLEEVGAWLSENSIPHIQLDCNRCHRAVLHSLFCQLQPPHVDRTMILERFDKVDPETANMLIDLGLRQNGPYGRMCPVLLHKNGLASYNTVGKYPVLAGKDIYWVSSDSLQEKFIKDCLLPQYDNIAFQPFRILVIESFHDNVHKLCKQLSSALGLPTIDIVSILDQLASQAAHGCAPKIQQKIMHCLRQGNLVEADILELILQDVVELQHPLGYILLGNPPSSYIPSATILYLSKTQPNFTSKSYPFVDMGKYQAYLQKNLQSGPISKWISMYDSVLTLEQGKSEWHDFELAKQYLQKIQAHQIEFLNGMMKSKRVLKIYQAGIDKTKVQLATTGSFCPVCLEQKVLSHLGDNWQYGSFYQDKVYLSCSVLHLQLFMECPEKFDQITAPTSVPQNILEDEAIQMFPSAFEMNGYCPVAYKKTGTFIDGSFKWSFRYNEKLYALSSDYYSLEFQKSPDLYTDFKKTFLLPVKIPQEMMPNIPSSQYLDIIFKLTVNDALKFVAHLRPKLPFQSVTVSGILFLGVWLKAHDNMANPYTRDKFKQLMNDMTKNAQLLIKLSTALTTCHNKFRNDLSNDIVKFMEQRNFVLGL